MHIFPRQHLDSREKYLIFCRSISACCNRNYYAQLVGALSIVLVCLSVCLSVHLLRTAANWNSSSYVTHKIFCNYMAQKYLNSPIPEQEKCIQLCRAENVAFRMHCNLRSRQFYYDVRVKFEADRCVAILERFYC